MSDQTFKNNPFGALKGTVPAPKGTVPAPKGTVPEPKGTVPELQGQSPSAPAVQGQSPSAPAVRGQTPSRAVVRMERAGRGGKEVTVIEHMALSPRERGDWLKALKAGLGCGGVVEGSNLVLQGDQRNRLPKLLEARGVKKITLG